ncbi:hypothetical protein CHS0354_028970 [Potamilus streckersoni]|uniref:non-specific serine/threonine protein kinase n=1 Tax=Potamilus streckersoni TaxID=2493646 RepID=A0AAE0SB09_9BIVA|nr:hypothetical protein CHS0354_028970 [Potamilus streckersoni]
MIIKKQVFLNFLHSKAMDKEEDHMTITFDNEESLLRGCVRLDKIQSLIKEKKKIKAIQFVGNGYCTDAVLYLLRNAPQGQFEELTEVNLLGCSLITDAGIKALSPILKASKKIEKVILDGCEQLTDNALALLHEVLPFGCKLSMKGTSVGYLHDVRIMNQTTEGCPILLTDSGVNVGQKNGSVLIVPHKNLTVSTADFLTDGKRMERRGWVQRSNWEVEDWNFTLSEVSTESCLFEHLIKKPLTQVVIPFDAGSALQDIKQHVIQTITKIVAKEGVSSKFPQKIAAIQTEISSDKFMDIGNIDKIFLEGNILKSISTSERSIGVYLSHTPITRSHPSFTVTATEVQEEKVTAIIIGVLYDVLFSARHPMESPEQHGGEVEGVEINVGDVVSFGVDGDWVSEYVPAEGARYFITVNGEERTKEWESTPHIGMYPLVSVLGKSIGAVRLNNLISPPEDWEQKCRSENRYLENGYKYNVLIDSNGVVRHVSNYNSSSELGYVLLRPCVSTECNIFNVRILSFNKENPESLLTIGIGPEVFKPGTKNSLLLRLIKKKITDRGQSGSGNDEDSKMEDLKIGDEFTIKVLGIKPHSGRNVVYDQQNLHVQFFQNGKLIEDVPDFDYQPDGEWCLSFLVGVGHDDDKVQILNYRTPYYEPPLIPDKITMGRSHFINVMDDGVLEYRKFQNRDSFAVFVSKTPLNKNMLYFDMEVLSVNDGKHLALGICPRDYPIDFLGWRQGSIAYHADNGGVYQNSSSFLKNTKLNPDEDVKFGPGDVIGFGIEDGPEGAIRFDNEGFIIPQQMLKYYFTKNMKRVHEYQYEFQCDGMYPAVAMHYENDKVKINNFYSETKRLRQQLELERVSKLQKVKEDKEKRDAIPPFHGCDFMVVSMSTGSSDPSGKMQLLKQQIKLQDDLEVLKIIEDKIQEVEKNLGVMNFQEQQNLSSLYAMRDNFHHLIEQPSRLKFMTLDLQSVKGRNELLQQLLLNQKCHEAHQENYYTLPTSVIEYQQKILLDLSKTRLMTLSQIQNDLPSSFSGKKCWKLLKHLESMGKLHLFMVKSDTLVADIAFLMEMEEKIMKLSPTVLSNNMPTCLGSTSHVWTLESLQKALCPEMTKDEFGFMQTVLEAVFGVIKIPCLRTHPVDELYMYTVLEKVSSPGTMNMRDFISDGKDLKDFVIINQSYSFPTGLPAKQLSLIMTSTAKYGRIILISPAGIVYQNGAVQTTIEQRKNNTGETVLTVESKCYMPEIDQSLDFTEIPKETASYVKEYTWGVFCIFTDLIDDILHKQSVTPIIIKNVPFGLVNTSVGCKHKWIFLPSPKKQTVCTLCNQCCDKGFKCEWNGIVSHHFRECGCGTDVTGCRDCGICKFCAVELWGIRTRLRPFASVTTVVREALGEKIEKPQVPEVATNPILLRDPVYQPLLFMDPVMYNEIEFINLSSAGKYLCLKEESSGSILQAYPGKPVYLKSGDLKNIQESKLRMLAGDHIRIKIEDKLGQADLPSEEIKGELLKSVPQYFASESREVRVCHDTGILCYDTQSSSIPVGQFIAPKPLTKENSKCSITILAPGDIKAIAIGLVPQDYPPNRQPGWNPRAIGYHADDGGIFIEAGFSTRRTETCDVGDVMEVEIDVDNKKGWFRKNGKQMIELNINLSKLGLYPCVGFHSKGEAVRLNEKEIWTAENKTDSSKIPPDFPTYKYGNLWISPGKKISLTKLGRSYSGWLILYNPKSDPVGYRVTVGKKVHVKIGQLNHQEHFLDFIDISDIKEAEQIYEATVEWISLDLGREYKSEDLENALNIMHGKFRHILSVGLVDASRGDTEQLMRVSDGTPEQKGMLCMQIFQNDRLLDEYWLRMGKYHVAVESTSKTAEFILKYPKCPSFTFPQSFAKGMMLTVYLENAKMYAESVVVDVYSGGKMLCLEYSPVNSTSNDTICVVANSLALKYPEFDEESSKILTYERRGISERVTRTFVPAPSFLLSEGGKKCQLFLDKEWKANSLRSMCKCFQVITRITVQEKYLTSLTKDIPKFRADSYKVFAFLPGPLSVETLCYPKIFTMFKDIQVHRLCFSASAMETWSNLSINLKDILWKISIHFIDTAGITPQKQLPINVLYADHTTGWIYIALLANKVLLPSYQKFIAGDSSSLTRSQVETKLYQLISYFASLCGIYGTYCGGLDNMTVTANAQQHITEIIEDSDQSRVLYLTTPHIENDVLIESLADCVCKAHLVCEKSRFVKFANESELSWDFIEPYAETVNYFQWKKQELIKLPDDFFTRFCNIQTFELGEKRSYLANFHSLPEGISTCKDLKIIHIQNTALQNLPKDFFEGPTVRIIKLERIPLTKITDHWPKKSSLKQLHLTGLLLNEIPDGIGEFNELIELDLSCNPITTLPNSLAKLSNLQTLSLNANESLMAGIPWITLEGHKSQLTKEQYESWHLDNPYIDMIFSPGTAEKLYVEFDTNCNSSLDEMEISQMNLKYFFEIPRLGINDINDAVTGGLPPVLFELKSLKKLELEFQAITMVPASINHLQNLQDLSLKHNPLLEQLPGTLGLLPNIQTIRLSSCPSLRTPPIEVVSRGFEPIKAYLKKLAGGFTECRRTKLMVVGLGGAGKTSLLMALTSMDKKTSGTEKENPTDGIDIKSWTVKNSENVDVTFSTWDFAGQAVYYNTHQFFLSKRAVYLLLWSMRQGFEHAGLDFWLSSISCHAPNTPIFVVGTQADLIPKAELPEKEYRERYPQIVSFHYVSSVAGIGVKELEQKLIETTLQLGYMGEKIPQVWLNLEKKIIAERANNSILKWEVVKSYAMEVGIYDEKDVKMAVQLLHDLGTLQYFDNDFLRDYVVINPQWIVDVMACVVSVQDSPIQKNNGRLYHKDIPIVWKDYEAHLHQWLLNLTEDFDLTFAIPTESVNMVPCLLPQEEPDHLDWPSVTGRSDVRETKMVYKFSYLPSGLFNRAQVRLLSFTEGQKVWKRGSLLKKNQHLALIRQISDLELVALAQGPRPENILFMIYEVFESIIEESFRGVSYDFFVPCPDCVTKEGTKDPWMFKADLVRLAVDHNAPILQCHKYFHWTSMKQLHEKMPSDSREVADFDFQLQNSLVALDTLSNEMSTDVAIIYCRADIPTKDHPDMMPPSLIRDDCVKWGYKCWFSEDPDNIRTEDITIAIKNCKILIACLSDSFEKDKMYRDIFIFAKETMNKDIISAVLGESFAWKETDLGMKCGEERQLIIKTLSRYQTGRQEELKEWLAEKIAHKKMDVVKNPDVFISYCWTNSEDAARKRGHREPDAIGYGDPREVKNYLQRNGIECWIDIEMIGKEKEGIFADMAVGLRKSKVLLACISDEYAKSENSMMEFRFGVLNLKLPIVVVVVGKGNQWREMELAMLLMKKANVYEVNLQNEDSNGLSNVYQSVRRALTDAENMKKSKDDNKTKENEKKENRNEINGNNSELSFKEEYELIQRKFMRHLIRLISNRDQSEPMPRLIIVDFIRARKKGDKYEGRETPAKPTPKKMLRPKSSTRSRDRMLTANMLGINTEEFEADAWENENLCLKLLCENEMEWHQCHQHHLLAFRTEEEKQTLLQKAAPYLSRIYRILNQSPIKLNCFIGKTGENYQDWIEKAAENNLDLYSAYSVLRDLIIGDEASHFVNCLQRCRLPSGKVFWLCKKHQEGNRITKLTRGTVGSHGVLQKVLFNEDVLFKEYMENYESYQKKKALVSKNVAPSLPLPVPLPSYEPVPNETNPNPNKPLVRRNTEPKDVTNQKTATKEGQPEVPTLSLSSTEELIQSSDRSGNSSASSTSSRSSLSVESIVAANQMSGVASMALSQTGRNKRLSRNHSKSKNPTSNACSIQ